MKKKITAFIVILCIFACSLAACGEGGGGALPQIYVEKNVIELKIGEKPNWSEYVTIKLGDEVLDNSTLQAVLTSGNENEVGRCTYKLTYQYGKNTITRNAFVNYVADGQIVDPQPDDKDKIKELDDMLAKTYTSYTFGYSYEVPEDKAYVHETDVVDGMKVHITYADNIKSDGTADENNPVTSYDYYIAEEGENVRYYRYSDSLEKWQYSEFTADEYLIMYSDLIPYAFLLNECNLDSTKFTDEGGGKYKVRNNAIDLVADAVFGLGESSVYDSIEFFAENGNIVRVKGEYTDIDQNGDVYGVVMEYTWSNFNSSSFQLPEASEVDNSLPVPDHTAPLTDGSLTTEQSEKLTAALQKEYSKISYTYTNDKGENNFFVSGNGKKDGNNNYGYLKQAAILNGVEKYSEDTAMYFTNDGTQYYLVYSDLGDWLVSALEENESISDYDSYISVAGMDLSADMFGFADDKYVVKADKLSALDAKMQKYFSTDEAYNKFELITFTLTLDENGNVNGWYLLADCNANRTDFYWQLSYSYTDFGTAVVTMPTEKTSEALTSAQISDLTEALNATYTNFTVTESMGTVMKFTETAVTAEGENNHEPFKDIYHIKDGKYYEVEGNLEKEIPLKGEAEGFLYYVLKPDFSLVDVSKVTYDGLNGVYRISAEDINANDFVFYWSNFYEQVGYNFTEFTFKVEGGKIVAVTGVSEIMTVTAVFGDFGTTTVTE